VRYEERGQGYRGVEKVGKYWFNLFKDEAQTALFEAPVRTAL
jgi:hypothetical protein